VSFEVLYEEWQGCWNLVWEGVTTEKALSGLELGPGVECGCGGGGIWRGREGPCLGRKSVCNLSCHDPSTGCQAVTSQKKAVLLWVQL